MHLHSAKHRLRKNLFPVFQLAMMCSRWKSPRMKLDHLTQKSILTLTSDKIPVRVRAELPRSTTAPIATLYSVTFALKALNFMQPKIPNFNPSPIKKYTCHNKELKNQQHVTAWSSFISFISLQTFSKIIDFYSYPSRQYHLLDPTTQ